MPTDVLCNLPKPGAPERTCTFMREHTANPDPYLRRHSWDRDGAARTDEPRPEMVEHPAHYGGADDPYEVIKVLEAWGLGFHLGNTVKYIARAGRKGGPAQYSRTSRRRASTSTARSTGRT